MLLLRSLILISDQYGTLLKSLRSLIIISDQHGAPTAISHIAHIPPTHSTSTIPHIHPHTHTLYHDKKTSFTQNKLTRGAQNLLHHKHPPTFNPAGTAWCEGTMSGGVLECRVILTTESTLSLQSDSPLTLRPWCKDTRTFNGYSFVPIHHHQTTPLPPGAPSPPAARGATSSSEQPPPA